MKYDVVIGLEIHAELSSKSKVFCQCAQQFGGEQNTRCCPRCSAMPGTLPLLNRTAVEYAVIAGLCLNCDINAFSAFDRKNYFYPDLPKAYQISQFFYPICTDGCVDIGSKTVRVNRIHIEEDAGKLIHDEYAGISLADYNRCGVPLIEIVTEPDMTCADEAIAFVEAVASRLRYAEVCDAKMEEGSIRCDVNISLKPEGSDVLGTRAEIKNLNSLKSISRAIEYEIKRQSDLLDRGERIIQETRRFNDNNGRTLSMRSKEEAHDYRYFPEPDIPAIMFDRTQIESIAAKIPMLPEQRLKIYVEEYGVSEVEAKIILTKKEYSDFFNAAVAEYPNYKSTSNLIVVEVFRLINDNGCDGDFKFTPQSLAKLIKMLDEDIITKAAQKTILSVMFERGGDPETIAKDMGLVIVNDSEGVANAIKEVIDANPKAVGEYRSGQEKVFGFLMGQVARKVGKSATPALVREMLLKALK
ncbi:MAG: Asp-tRNA(Asn)/Glu-tRNA(Gln) amidotransferase subunit GatB [Clostridia bacterium]|nr:Asp-tRNA(Asn)/Glu-tRNA(Gln) amidotransferase subunit GatB [Clostridia bacterium]